MEEQSPDLQRLCELTYPRWRVSDHTLDDNLPGFPYETGHDGWFSPTTNAGSLDVLLPELLGGDSLPERPGLRG